MSNDNSLRAYCYIKQGQQLISATVPLEEYEGHLYAILEINGKEIRHKIDHSLLSELRDGVVTHVYNYVF